MFNYLKNWFNLLKVNQNLEQQVADLKKELEVNKKVNKELENKVCLSEDVIKKLKDFYKLSIDNLKEELETQKQLTHQWHEAYNILFEYQEEIESELVVKLEETIEELIEERDKLEETSEEMRESFRKVERLLDNIYEVADQY